MCNAHSGAVNIDVVRIASAEAHRRRAEEHRAPAAPPCRRHAQERKREHVRHRRPRITQEREKSAGDCQSSRRVRRRDPSQGSEAAETGRARAIPAARRRGDPRDVRPRAAAISEAAARAHACPASRQPDSRPGG